MSPGANQARPLFHMAERSAPETMRYRSSASGVLLVARVESGQARFSLAVVANGDTTQLFKSDAFGEGVKKLLWGVVLVEESNELDAHLRLPLPEVIEVGLEPVGGDARAAVVAVRVA